MKKVTVISMALSFPGERASASRFYYIADMLKKNGYDVTLLTGSFDHGQKRQRTGKLQSNVKYKLAYQPSYQKNLGIKRIYSLLVFTCNVLKIFKTLQTDIVYCSIPDNLMAAMVFWVAKKRRIKSVLDIEDLWPEAMEMYLNTHHLGVVKCLLFPYRIFARCAYSMADAYIGTSMEYTDHYKKYVGDRSNKPKETVYVGNDIDAFDAAVINNAGKIEKKDCFWVTYAGTIGVSYDIRTMIDAAIKLKRKGYEDIKFKILGDGETRDILEQYASLSYCNVEFLGYQPYEIMAAYLSQSDVLVNSLVKSAPQSIVTKIGDYLAAGRPMINTCSSRECQQLVAKHKVGINIEAEDAIILSKAVIQLYRSEHMCQEYGKNARRLAEQKFNRKIAYRAIIDVLETI